MAAIVAATAFNPIAPANLRLTKASSAAEESFRTIDYVSEICPLSSAGKKPNECLCHIEMAGIHFACPARAHIPVSKGLKRLVAARKATTIVRSSNPGKNTIVGLRERWYEHSEGKIHLDGLDTGALNLNRLRKNMRLEFIGQLAKIGSFVGSKPLM